MQHWVFLDFLFIYLFLHWIEFFVIIQLLQQIFKQCLSSVRTIDYIKKMWIKTTKTFLIPVLWRFILNMITHLN